MINLKIAQISFLMFFFSACGYNFQGSTSSLPSDVKTVAIPIVENDTVVAGLGLKFTEALRSRFERYGIVKVVNNQASADAVLIARIKDVETDTQNVTSNTDIALEQKITLTVAADLKRQNGQILWQNKSLKTSETFASVSDVVVTSSSDFAQSGIGSDTLGSLGSREVSRAQEEQALDDLVEEASRKLYLNAVAADF